MLQEVHPAQSTPARVKTLRSQSLHCVKSTRPHLSEGGSALAQKSSMSNHFKNGASILACARSCSRTSKDGRRTTNPAPQEINGRNSCLLYLNLAKSATLKTYDGGLPIEVQRS